MSKMMKENIDLVMIVIFLVTLLTGVMTNYHSIFNIANAFAIAAFLIVQQPQTKKPDERDYYINNKASSWAFILTLTVILFMNVALDLNILIQNVSSSGLLTGIISIMFMSYTVTYAYLKRTH